MRAVPTISRFSERLLANATIAAAISSVEGGSGWSSMYSPTFIVTGLRGPKNIAIYNQRNIRTLPERDH
jgi:hypothetical protein